MNSVIKYPGSKWSIANWIISHFPSHHSYLEPFFGSGAVLFTKKRSPIETVNDLDKDVVNLFRQIRENTERLADTIYWTPYATIIGGYGDLYLLAEREGSSVGYSDQPLYLQDQTVVKGTARYDGQPSIPEGFVAIGIGKPPVTSVSFPQDVANPAVAALQSLTIGGLTLRPAFASGTDTYTAATSNAKDAISAVPTMGSTVTITVGKTRVQNGGEATWASGKNVVSITVNNGKNSKVYTVTVTKE